MKAKNWLEISLFAIASLAVSGCSETKPEAGTRIIAVKAGKYQFTPGQIKLTKGETVRLQLTSDDMTHGLFMKDLAIDADIVPGVTTELTVTPQTAGKFTAICGRYCGPGHGNMRMTILVE